MSSAGTDIIIPIWNNPTETRECLASLVEHSADFRLILLDTGSDSATEQLLHEFADFLDNRALLMRSDTTQGFVATVNRGLARAEAPLVVVMRSSTRVRSGWLEPLQEAARKTDAGILVPRLELFGSGSSSTKKCDHPGGEVHHGSFSALGITRKLYAAIGGFDESLDGDLWCLKDYSRRADRAGFTTLRVAGPAILYREIIAYGSRERREKMVRESIATCTARWGEARTYCAFFASRSDLETLGKAFAVMLTAARRGHRFFVFASPPVYRLIQSASLHLQHDAVLVYKLPRIFLQRACRTVFARVRASHSDVSVLTGLDGLLDLKGGNRVSFAEVEKSISAAEV